MINAYLLGLMEMNLLPSRYVQDQMFSDKFLRENQTIRHIFNKLEICTCALIKTHFNFIRGKY